jgi:hypothetical protein
MTAPSSGLQALRELVDRLGREPQAVVAETRPQAASSSRLPGPPATPENPVLPSPRPLKTAQRHQASWQRLRTEQRLRRLRDALPPQAGPLHSASLIHRALAQMQAVSPEYLDHWLRSVDDLLALERIAARTRR